MYIVIIASFVRLNKRSNVRFKKRELSSWARKKLCVIWKQDWPKPRSLMNKEAPMNHIIIIHHPKEREPAIPFESPFIIKPDIWLLYSHSINPLYPQFLMVTLYYYLASICFDIQAYGHVKRLWLLPSLLDIDLLNGLWLYCILCWLTAVSIKGYGHCCIVFAYQLLVT